MLVACIHKIINIIMFMTSILLTLRIDFDQRVARCSATQIIALVPLLDLFCTSLCNSAIASFLLAIDPSNWRVAYEFE